MKHILLIVLLIPVLAKAQNNGTSKDLLKGESAVFWIDGLTWAQIKAKAKAEKKYIFLDCHATWCMPCKKMDKEVFVNDSVGSAVNSNFIAVKVQMDTSKNDDEFVRKWYEDANELNKQYKVTSFPTFLFLSPEGEILHRSGGYMSTQRFISLTKDALDPNKQYYTLLRNYKKGIKDYGNMKYLASLARFYEVNGMGERIALDYINNYLVKRSKKEIYTKENISFLTSFLNSSSSKAFRLVYQSAQKVNKILGRQGFTEAWVQYIITKEDIEPVISVTNKTSAGSPDWGKLTSTIKRKYNAYYANRTIIDAKSRWHASKRNWAEFTKYTVEFVEKYGSNMRDFDLATGAWSVFEYSTKKEELNAALRWSKRILERSKDSTNMIPAVMDTYANLTYKIDYLFNNNKSSSDALAIEEKALDMATKYEIENFKKSFAKVIEKMKNSQPTWKLQ